MSWKDTLHHSKDQVRSLNKAMPDITRAFGGLSKAVKEGDGPLDFKTKEYIALGIAVATRCETCVALHMEALVRIGATREEVADALGMTIQMSGAPGLMYAAKALECYDQLSA